MKTKIRWLIMLLFTIQISFAQEKIINGNITDDNGVTLPGVNVVVKGTSKGVSTGFDGKYSIKAEEGEILIFSFLGMTDISRTIGNTNIINIVMRDNSKQLNEVVVTALGLKREKKSLGYSTQEIKGDDLTKINSGNVANSISGKVSGVDIRRNGNIGGSTNVVIRGTKSLTGNNQALWIIDGIPIDNSNSNSNNQRTGRNGYDYGNAASDINPDDIETINVLKGSAASALYGSRAANGVIMVTTKKGSKASSGIGVTINSGFTFGKVDKKTLPEYQTQYGAGYGKYNGSSGDSYFNDEDVDGDGLSDLVITSNDDASFGAAFDPNLIVYQWNSFYPELSTYKKATPWVAAKNNPNSFYENSLTLTNSVALAAGNEKGNARFSYTRFDQKGILPNSNLIKDNFNLSAKYDLSSKVSFSASANYTKLNLKGANETGYGAGGNNVTSSFRQWWQTNVDIYELRDAYFNTGRNLSWNPNSRTDLRIAFHDNPYFNRYENYNTQRRDRFLGNLTLNTKLSTWLDAITRIGLDGYNEVQEEIFAIGSKRIEKQAGAYSRFNRNFREYNLELLLDAKTKINENFNFKTLAGVNIRRSNLNSIFASTQGGLVIPYIYSLNNSKEIASAPTEAEQNIGVNSFFANIGIDYRQTLFLEGSYRIDQSSTLPSKNNLYKYPSLSGTYIFSNHLKNNWLSYGKLRLNYAETGNGAGFAEITPTYIKGTNYLNSYIFSTEDFKRNPDLKAETTKAYEAGIEIKLFKNRISFEGTMYKSETLDQVVQATPSSASGYRTIIINAGNIENKGIELSLGIKPIQTEKFAWDTKINWSKNRGIVSGLPTDELVIGAYGTSLGISNVAINGQPTGIIKGSGYRYTNGQPTIDPTTGNYFIENNKIIGNFNPEWIAGINNTFSYKTLSLSFLVDIRKGGSVFSADQAYGQNTGLYENTVGTNDKGFPIRNTVANGGGQILPGVLPNGSVNTIYTEVTDPNNYYQSNLGYATFPMEAFVYDASYVKLREVSLKYQLPTKYLKGAFINGLSISLNGSNLWIIHKNLPYADPEAGLSSGNLQGFQTGVLPSTKEFSFNIKTQF